MCVGEKKKKKKEEEEEEEEERRRKKKKKKKKKEKEEERRRRRRRKKKKKKKNTKKKEEEEERRRRRKKKKKVEEEEEVRRRKKKKNKKKKKEEEQQQQKDEDERRIESLCIHVALLKKLLCSRNQRRTLYNSLRNRRVSTLFFPHTPYVLKRSAGYPLCNDILYTIFNIECSDTRFINRGEQNCTPNVDRIKSIRETTSM